MTAISRNTLEALEILKELDEAGKSNNHYVMTRTPTRPDLVRRSLRLLANDRDWVKRLTTAVDGKMLFIHLKESSRVEVLEQALEKAIQYIDDEAIYEELMQVLYGMEAK